jgi:hypothetical protein
MDPTGRRILSRRAEYSVRCDLLHPQFFALVNKLTVSDPLAIGKASRLGSIW